MSTQLQADAEWNAGELGCGEFVLELKRRLDVMTAGSVLHLTARDPGVPADLAAWCRMTGHRLLQSAPPEFQIERRPN